MKKKLAELKKVAWPKPKEIAINSLMVVAFTAIMTLLIYFEDLIISSISSLLA